MTQSLATDPPPGDFAVHGGVGPASSLAAAPGALVESRMDELAVLVGGAHVETLPADAVFVNAPDSEADQRDLENRLAQVRLGLASSLFTALRLRDAATAAHSVRVALGCSAWSLALELPEDERDAIEVAALLHDIGKIGVPDGVLLKPAALTSEERVIMDHHRQ